MSFGRHTTNEALAIAAGALGFDRVAPGASVDGRYAFVLVVEDDVTFGGATTMALGDSPAGDTFGPGSVIPGPFTAVENDGASVGIMYAYFG